MSTITRGKLREVVTGVKVNSKIVYGFKTRDLAAGAGVSAADLTALGHINLSGTGTIATGMYLVMGCNSPKPARFTKRVSGTAPAGATYGMSVSTFCAFDAQQAAVAAGWTLSKSGRGASLVSTGKKSVIALVPMGNLVYAYPMDATDFANYKSVLGLGDASTVTTAAELAKVFRNSSNRVPGRATKKLTAGSITSYYNPNKVADLSQSTAGWHILSYAEGIAS